MRKVIHKLFWIWQFEEEEKWLNEMAARGLGLISVKMLAYEFEDTLPGEYRIGVQVLEHRLHHPETEDYINFLEEIGIEHVGTIARSSYFRRKAAEGDFELFSDNSSRIKQLKNIIRLLAILICPNIYNLCYNTFLCKQYFHPVLVFGILLCAFVTGSLAYGIIKFTLKIKKLENEQQIFE